VRGGKSIDISADASGQNAVEQGADHTPNLTQVMVEAEAGNKEAQYQAGNTYAKVRGVAKDDIEAAGWWRRAADQAFAPAQNALSYV